MRRRARLAGRSRSALLGACASEYETFDPPPLDFSDRQPLRLAVERVAIDTVYRPAGAPPYVDHALPLTPEAATRALLEQTAAGGRRHGPPAGGDPRCLG